MCPSPAKPSAWRLLITLAALGGGGCVFAPWWICLLAVSAGLTVMHFPSALFALMLLAIVQGKVGLLMTTPADVIIDKIYLLELYLPFFLLSFFRHKCLSRETDPAPRPHRLTCELALVAGLFVAWCGLSIAFADWSIRAWLKMMHLTCFFIYSCCLLQLSERDLRCLFSTTIPLGLVMFVAAQICVQGIALEFDDIRLTPSLLWRQTYFSGGKRASVMSPPAVTSVTLGLYAWCIYVLAWLHSGWKRQCLLLCGFLVTLAMFYTRTRSEMVAFAVASACFAILIGWKQRRVLRGLLTSFAYIVLVWVVAAGLDFASATKRLAVSTDVAEKASLGIRIDLWRDGLTHVLSHGTTGFGTGGFFTYRALWPHAHNVYFSVLFDQGIVGMALWSLFFIGLWRLTLYGLRMAPANSEQWLIMAGLTALFVQVSVTSLLQHEYSHFIWWLTPGLLMAHFNHIAARFAAVKAPQHVPAQRPLPSEI